MFSHLFTRGSLVTTACSLYFYSCFNRVCVALSCIHTTPILGRFGPIPTFFEKIGGGTHTVKFLGRSVKFPRLKKICKFLIFWNYRGGHSHYSENRPNLWILIIFEKSAGVTHTTPILFFSDSWPKSTFSKNRECALTLLRLSAGSAASKFIMIIFIILNRGSSYLLIQVAAYINRPTLLRYLL